MPHPVPEAQFKRQLKGRHADKFEKVYEVRAEKDASLTAATIKAATNKLITADIDKRGWKKCRVDLADRKDVLDGKRCVCSFLHVIVSKHTD